MGSVRAFTLPAARRLRSPVEFAAVTSDPQALRAARAYLAVAGRLAVSTDKRPAVRFGFTAGKRQARRATERNTVKRVMREAARLAAPMLDEAVGSQALDVVLRLKAPVPPHASAGRTAFKHTLRLEADSLLAQLAHRIMAARRG